MITNESFTDAFNEAGNTFEELIFPLYPELVTCKDFFTSRGFPTLMTGSGPTMVVLLDKASQALALQEEITDEKKLRLAARTANIEEFVESLTLKYKTVIGVDGQGLSQGQKQRILIARAVYKNPHFIFFDEATNSLDANNEAIIMKNLEQFFLDKTVVIVAHRLSTVRNADQIIVLDKGMVVETGTHADLINNKNTYYNLVKNQLELGN